MTEVARRLLRGEGRPGAFTPAALFGARPGDRRRRHLHPDRSRGMTATHRPSGSSRRGTFRVGPAPAPAPGPGEVVVEAHAVALNPVDAMPAVARRFVYPWLRLPTVLGTDVAGTVVAVGAGVSRFRVGDRVVGFASGQEKFRNDPAHGAFQHVVVLDADLTAPVPDDVALTDAAVLPLALTTAAAGLFEPDQLGLPLPAGTPVDASGERDETVLVWGAATSVGNNAVQLARAAGYRVVATASPRSAALVLGLGASAVVDYRARSAVDEVVAALEGHTARRDRRDRGGLAGPDDPGRPAYGGHPAGRLGLPEPGHRRAPAARPAVRRPGLGDLGRGAGADRGRPGDVPRRPAGRSRATVATGPRPRREVVGDDLASIPAGLERLRGGVAARKLVVRLRRDPDPR